MSIQTFSLAAVQKARRYIQETLVLADSKQQSPPRAAQTGDELPEPESLDELSGIFTRAGRSIESSTFQPDQSWMISTVNPSAALLKLPGLQLKSGFRLVSYLYRSENDGVGVVYAVPASLSPIAQLEQALIHSSNTQPPRPAGALPHFMEAIEGNQTPASFLLASLLHRELLEFGATGQRCSWSHHRLIDAVPLQVKWQWRTDLPQDLSPKVKRLADGGAAVEFFSCRLRPVALYRHLDHYAAGCYRPKCLDKPIAIPQR